MCRRGIRVYAPSSFARGGKTGITFRIDQFEPAVLSALAELDTRELIDREEGPDEVAELSAKLTRLDAQLQALADQFDSEEEIPQIAAKVKDLHGKRKAAAEALDKAKGKVASPLSAAVGEARGLVKIMEDAKNARDVRLRLRQALARIIEEVWCLFMPGRENRVGVVQIWFADGAKHRDYLITHTNADPRIAKGRRCWSVRSLAAAGLPALDLRDPKQAARLEAAILRANAKADAK